MAEFSPNELFKNPRALPDDSLPGSAGSLRELSPQDLFKSSSVMQDKRQLSKYDPIREMSTIDLISAGAGKYLVDTGHGVQQLGLDLIRSPTTSSFAQNEDLRKQQDAPLMNTGAGQAGYALGAIGANTVAAAIPGLTSLALPRNVAQGAISGAIQGGLLPRGTNDELGQNILIGGGAGFAGNAIAQLPSRIAQPVQGLSTEAQDLIKQNVIPTPGQAVDRSKVFGRVMSKLEEVASSIPVVGDFISHGRNRAVTEFNAAALARAGGTGAGQEAIDSAHKTLNSAFDNLTSNTKIKLDNTFHVDLTDLTLTDEARKLVKGKIDNIFNAAQNGELTGSAYQKFRGELNAASRNYIRSPLPSDRDVGFALGRIADGLDGAFAAQAPADVQQAWQVARNQWANLRIVEDAAYKAANNKGIFTPNQLTQSMKSAAPTKAKVAAGDARMQDLTDAGSVLSNKLANSGTADRMWPGLLAGGAGAGYLGYLPEAAAGMAALAGTYGTRTGAEYMVGAAYPWQYPVSTLLGVPIPYVSQGLSTFLQQKAKTPR